MPLQSLLLMNCSQPRAQAATVVAHVVGARRRGALVPMMIMRVHASVALHVDVIQQRIKRSAIQDGRRMLKATRTLHSVQVGASKVTEIAQGEVVVVPDEQSALTANPGSAAGDVWCLLSLTKDSS